VLAVNNNCKAVDKATNDVTPSNGKFAVCSCNLTGGCDAACCCDTDCPASTVAEWRQTSDFCIDEKDYGAELPFSECIARYKEPWLDDLKGGLQVYEKIYRSLLCTQRVSERTLTSTWLDT